MNRFPRKSRPLQKIEAACCFAVALCLTPSAMAALSATATITTMQTSPPYDYTVTLHNTGDTNLGTLWFAWTDVPADYNFMPTIPTNVTGPAGWLLPVTHNGVSDGYGIQWYNRSGSPVPPGGMTTFGFRSNTSPATLAGTTITHGLEFPVTSSVAYIGPAFGDPGYYFVVTVVPPVTVLLGDMNCDGAVNLADVSAFATALVDLSAYTGQFPTCDPVLHGDFSNNSTLDAGDIAGFIAVLVP